MEARRVQGEVDFCGGHVWGTWWAALRPWRLPFLWFLSWPQLSCREKGPYVIDISMVHSWVGVGETVILPLLQREGVSC